LKKRIKLESAVSECSGLLVKEEQTHIGREYGLPWVIGVPEGTSEIHTGDLVTVDRYLGIVTIE